jgi:CO dehydrogenase/acetyl-CoA synthase beta subunit
MINTRALKESISNSNIPEDLKNLILTTEDAISEDQFLTKFIEWRKIARIKEATK